MRNDFFLGPKIFEGQSESFICCKSLFDGYNHFGSKNSIREILALESPESRKSSERPSATLCVKVSSTSGFRADFRTHGISSIKTQRMNQSELVMA